MKKDLASLSRSFVPGILFLLCACNASAQVKSSYTQYILNNFVLNPAVTGIENYTDIKMSSRNQWTGINGAPVTNYLTIHTAIGKTDMRTSATSFEVPGQNPRGTNYWENYTAPKAHHGVGFSAMNDKAGYINRWSLSGSYAYHLPLSIKTTLAAGFSAGITSINIDRSKIDFGSLDPTDPAVGYTSGALKPVRPELGAGLWLYSADYFAGVSVLNIVPGKVRFGSNNDFASYIAPNYFLTAGYRFSVSDNLNVIPSFMLQYWQPQLFGVHANAKLQYQDRFWVGGSYRYGDLISGFAGMAGVNISNTLNLSYAYEVATTNRLRAYTGNTHEIMIGFILGNKYGDLCPRNVW